MCLTLSPLAATQLIAADELVKARSGSAISVFENRIADQLMTQIDNDFALLPMDGLGLEYRVARIVGSRLAVLAHYQQQIDSLDPKLLDPNNSLRLAALQATQQQLQQQRDYATQDAALSPYHGPHIDLLRLVSLLPINPNSTATGPLDQTNPDDGISPLLAELALLGRTLNKPVILSPLMTTQECITVIASLTQAVEAKQLTDSLDLRLLDAGVDAATRRDYHDKFSATLQQHVLPGLTKLADGLSCDDVGPGTDLAYYAYRLQRFGAAQRHADAVHALGQKALGDLQIEITLLWQSLHAENPADHPTLAEIRKDALLYLGTTAAARQGHLSRLSDLVISVQKQLAATVLDLALPDLEIIAEPDLLAASSLPFTYRFTRGGPAQLAVNFNSTASFSQHQLVARTYYSTIPGQHLVRHGFVNRADRQASPLLGIADNPAYFDGWPLYLTNLLLNDASQISLTRLGLLELNAEMSAMLVIDTGLHELGWSRQAAINFLITNTVMATYHAERLVDEVRFRPASMNSTYLGMTQIETLLADASGQNRDNKPSLSWQAALAAGPVTASLQQALRDWLTERQ
ncbi:MAG: hypothetical protein ACI9SB_002226 [Candidatus Azotimanducaceae bacterium]|jgi:uncharacterized protein (DUF885 family)